MFLIMTGEELIFAVSADQRVCLDLFSYFVSVLNDTEEIVFPNIVKLN